MGLGTGELRISSCSYFSSPTIFDSFEFKEGTNSFCSVKCFQEKNNIQKMLKGKLLCFLFGKRKNIYLVGFLEMVLD